MDRRYTKRSECRESVSSGGITGYAAVFYNHEDRGTEYELPTFNSQRVVERIRPGAFDRAIHEDDVRGLFNHDQNYVLGRSTAGTMKLSVDSRGLRYQIDLPDTQMGRDIRESIKRGDITGSSFAFQATDTAWEEDGDVTVRYLNSVELFDVGPVTYPAYQASTTMARCCDDAKKEYDAWKYIERSQQEAAQAEVEQARARRNLARGLSVDVWNL